MANIFGETNTTGLIDAGALTDEMVELASWTGASSDADRTFTLPNSWTWADLLVEFEFVFCTVGVDHLSGRYSQTLFLPDMVDGAVASSTIFAYYRLSTNTLTRAAIDAVSSADTTFTVSLQTDTDIESFRMWGVRKRKQVVDPSLVPVVDARDLLISTTDVGDNDILTLPGAKTWADIALEYERIEFLVAVGSESFTATFDTQGVIDADNALIYRYLSGSTTRFGRISQVDSAGTTLEATINTGISWGDFKMWGHRGQKSVIPTRDMLITNPETALIDCTLQTNGDGTVTFRPTIGSIDIDETSDSTTAVLTSNADGTFRLEEPAEIPLGAGSGRVKTTKTDQNSNSYTQILEAGINQMELSGTNPGFVEVVFDTPFTSAPVIHVTHAAGNSTGTHDYSLNVLASSRLDGFTLLVYNPSTEATLTGTTIGSNYHWTAVGART